MCLSKVLIHMLTAVNDKGKEFEILDFFIFFQYFIQHCIIYRPSFTASGDVRTEPRTVVT
jgi:hypothetical protein